MRSSSENRIRNVSITKAVINGYTLKEVAKKHNLSKERIRQIVSKTCRKANSSYKYLTKTANLQGLSSVPIRWLRNHRDVWIYYLNNYLLKGGNQ